MTADYKINKPDKGYAPLDPNHTHHFLVDDGKLWYIRRKVLSDPSYGKGVLTLFTWMVSHLYGFLLQYIILFRFILSIYLTSVLLLVFDQYICHVHRC